MCHQCSTVRFALSASRPCYLSMFVPRYRSIRPFQTAVLVGVVLLPVIKLTVPYLKRLAHPLAPISCLNDDLLYEIFSYLDPKEAARAALVCARWHHNATHAAYNSIFLHSTSPSSYALSRTLLACPHLCTHVQHVTVLHCTPDCRDSLYAWLDYLPGGSLKSCRVISVLAGQTELIVGRQACITAEILEVTQVGSHRPPESIHLRALLHNTSWQFVPPDGPDQCAEDIGPVVSLPFPTVIERMLATLRMDPGPRALRQTSTYRHTTRAADKLTAETLHGFARAQEGILPSMTICRIHIFFQPQEFFSDLLKQTMARGATLQEAKETIFDRNNDAEVKCACVWPGSRDWEVPPSAYSVVGTYFTRDGLTLASVTRVIDQLWTYTEQHGRVVHLVELDFRYYTEGFVNILGPPCDVCHISKLNLTYTR
ncbi:hypothetical protein C2E23DRAFT_75884 [Lenzites betulinus]|nr:hypothetical protein C2E23DRAFT_75884 [Lenzites betulinus]